MGFAKCQPLIRSQGSHGMTGRRRDRSDAGASDDPVVSTVLTVVLVLPKDTPARDKGASAAGREVSNAIGFAYSIAHHPVIDVVQKSLCRTR